MIDGSTKLIALGDFFRDGRALLIQDKPTSPYRYIEFLIEGTLQRKFGLKKVVELGPGSDSGLAYLDVDSLESALAIDYNQDALDVVKSRIATHKLDCRLADITVSNVLRDLDGRFDYVICNSLIEHVIDDAALVRTMSNLLAPGGIVVCTTVLQPGLYNLWDHAVGHYRRYELKRLTELFRDFSTVQVLQTSIAQELSRPLFFNRIRHLEKNTVEQNNRLTAVGQQEWGRVPYAGIWPIVKYAMPLYLVAEWGLNYVPGGIGFVIGRK